MSYAKAKIYFDGSHYIAVPYEHFSHGKKQSKSTTTTPHKAEFESAYRASQTLPKRERKAFIVEQIKSEFKTDEQAKEYVEQQTERKKTNAIKRSVRLIRKVNLQQWDYFVTFTYDGNKLDETAFKKKLMNTLKHLVSRKQWKYIGVWERSPEKQRLHFHGIFYIPENSMIGELVKVTDYDTRNNRQQTTYQNTHFLKHFGRNDFKELNMQSDVAQSVRYLLKYIEKSGERLVFGGKLPTYFISDVMDEDIICPYGVDERKFILFDDFKCWDEGLYMGKVNPEVIKQMPKTN